MLYGGYSFRGDDGQLPALPHGFSELAVRVQSLEGCSRGSGSSVHLFLQYGMQRAAGHL